MTLDLSKKTILPLNPSEDNLVSSVRVASGYVIEGIPEKNGGGYSMPQHFNWEFENSPYRGKEKADKGGSFESVTHDIHDLLPSDPFGMEISANFTAITGWVEDFEPDRLNFIWNRAMKFQKEPGNMESYGRSNPNGGSRDEIGSESREDGWASICNAQEFQVVIQRTKESEEGTGSFPGRDEGAPNDALLFALNYLGVGDLLSVERVCRSLHSAVQSDVLLWKNIHIDQPLNERITDDALLRLTNRAQGNLLSLSLVGCSRITDDGLKCILECNPRLTKLNVAGCIGLSNDGLVNNLKAFKSSGTSGIEHLRIGSRYGVTPKHFEELMSLVGADTQPKANKPHFYHYGHSSLSCDDNRAIDIEICPRCQHLRLVYDCPVESCKRKQPGTQLCRACIICISRCVECGRCVNDTEYEETFSLDLLCLDCWKQLFCCQEGQKEKGAYLEHTVFHHETRYCLRLCG